MADWLFIAIPLALAIAAYILYARMIRLRNRGLEALSSIDVQLNKRHDLIPNMVKLAGKFMSHERDLLERVVELRNQAHGSYDPGEGAEVERHFAAEAALQQGLGQFRVAVEDYPELKSQGPMMEAQEALLETEGHIAASRRFYNSAVNELNTAIEIFPGSIFAAIAKVQPMPFFELEDEAARAPINVDDLLP